MGFLEGAEVGVSVDMVRPGDADLRGESGGVAESLRSLVSVSSALDESESE